MAKNPTNIRRGTHFHGALRQGSASLVPKTPEQNLYLAYVDDVIAALYDKPYQFMIKRTMDIGLVLVGMMVVLPLIALVALLIKLDSPGPVFFTQVRIGRNGRPFKMYKLRSMVVNAEAQRNQLEAMNETAGIIFKIQADPRVTRVGRFIRKYSIDELPQLFNVLKGDMSLVGPRPLPIENVQKFHKHHFNWFKVPPGVTGAWQTSGRSSLKDFEDIYNLEREYIETWSLRKDIGLLFKTVTVVLSAKGAC